MDKTQCFEMVNADEEYYYEDEDSSLLSDNEEWLKYLADCEEWSEETIVENDDFVEVSQMKRMAIHKPFILDEDNFYDENSMISLGMINTREKKKKSFKYNYNKSNKHIFCSSLLNTKNDNKKCFGDSCKNPHKFSEILYCHGKCGKITYENNFYTGNCNKRHLKETLENFVLRKNIKLKSCKTAEFCFYDKPTSEFIIELLVQAKSLLFEEIKIRIIPRPKTMEDFLKDRVTDDIIPSDYVFLDEDFNKIWC